MPSQQLALGRKCRRTRCRRNYLMPYRLRSTPKSRTFRDSTRTAAPRLRGRWHCGQEPTKVKCRLSTVNCQHNMSHRRHVHVILQDRSGSTTSEPSWQGYLSRFVYSLHRTWGTRPSKIVTLAEAGCFIDGVGTERTKAFKLYRTGQCAPCCTIAPAQC